MSLSLGSFLLGGDKLSYTPKFDLSKGSYTRTVFDESSRRIILSPRTFLSSNARDWINISNPLITMDGDKAIVDNPTGSDTFSSIIHFLNQSQARDVIFRLKAKGENIQGTEFNGNFSMQLILTYSGSGLGGELTSQSIAFPNGSWGETQFTLRVNATKPVVYIYPYIFYRNNTGKLTFWDVEIFEVQSTNQSDIGYWESECIDVVRAKNEPISENTLKLETHCYHYERIDRLHNMNSITHGINWFSKFDHLITKTPNGMNDQELEIVLALIEKGVKVWGYIHIGSTPEIPLLEQEALETAINSCQEHGLYGVFFDMAGYDYGVTREEQNEHIAYCHERNLKVFANAWFPSQLLLSTVGENNPEGIDTLLGEGDWVLLESFYSRGDNVYVSQYESWDAAFSKYIGAVNMAHPLGVKIASLAYRFSGQKFSETRDRDNSYIMSAMCGLDGWSFGGTTNSDPFIPDLKLGNEITSLDIYKPAAKTWEINSDKGIIWFKDDDGVISTGSFSTDVESRASFDNAVRNRIIAGRTTLDWLTSDDNENWVEWKNNDAVKRYIKVRAKLIR